MCLQYGGLIGQAKAWLASNTQYSHPDSIRRPCCEKQDRRFTFFSIGANPHEHPTKQIRSSLLANSILNLNKKVFFNSSLGEDFNHNDAYYSHVAVKMLFEDMHTVNCAYQEVIEQLPTPAIEANALDAIDKITLRAIGLLTSFCDLLADDTAITIGQIVTAIDS